MDVNRERVQLWAEALESGEFEQGKNCLRFQTKSGIQYCCLGVAVEVALRNGYEPQTISPGYGFLQYEESWGELRTSLWPGVVKWYGLDSPDPHIGLFITELAEHLPDCVVAPITETREREGYGELFASSANDDYEVPFTMIAAGIRAKYLTPVEDTDVVPQ